eukprot:351061-Chlamydomonas_euryale.AAC.2
MGNGGWRMGNAPRQRCDCDVRPLTHFVHSLKTNGTVGRAHGGDRAPALSLRSVLHRRPIFDSLTTRPRSRSTPGSLARSLARPCRKV